MKSSVRTGLWLLVIVIVAFPVTFVVTFLLVPLWRWIEATYGIESIGHSGPADWCFWTIFGLYLLIGGMVMWLFRSRRR